jgi:hypothetical protein
MHSRRSQAPAHIAAARRCMQRTSEVQRRQLRHPSETRCQRRCPSCSELIGTIVVCIHRRPRLAPRRTPTTRSAPHATASANSTNHHLCTTGARKHPLTAQLPVDARSVPPRTSHVSCVILPRLGASDAAPSSWISLPARTAAPRLAPRRTFTSRYSPARNRLSPKHASASAHCRSSQAPAHSAAARRCMQRTAEVQRLQLRHPSETRCQRRCPSISEVIDCTHRRPSARPSQALTIHYRPTRNRPSPQHATSSMHSRRSQAPAHSAYARSVQLRFSDVSCVILKRLGASDAAPAASMSVTAHTAAPRLALGKPSPPATAPRATAPAHTTQHHQRTAGFRKHPLTALLPADACSVQLRSSHVSCVILPRLGASDAAPAALMSLPARIAAPRLTPREPRHQLQRRMQPPQPTAPNIIHAQPALASTRSQRSGPPMHAAYF